MFGQAFLTAKCVTLDSRIIKKKRHEYKRAVCSLENNTETKEVYNRSIDTNKTKRQANSYCEDKRINEQF